MSINYEKLLDDWGEKILDEADKAEKRREDLEVGCYKDALNRGYSDGLRMALTILNRMESKLKQNK